ncbi:MULTISPECIES: alpha/beta hydrolase family protein [unclassified Lentilitoribacter]|uniref:alpha/beta hydrolase family protein n=1 Tax=unclassified Lentilitoribacter TaxID=2647570 RepID=UPI0013A6A66E|nr:alpha/beta hydrolase [Lentilitoribacter sp. Alg239-R112]
MLTRIKRFLLQLVPISTLVLLFGMISLSNALELKPFKDKLFAYPEILSSKDNGDYLLVKYDKQINIHKRDQVPIRKVKQKYVKLGLRRFQTYQEFQYAGRNIEIGFVAKKGAPKFAVLFIHGRDGDRKLGLKDYTFGGNFNRLKNLAVRNNGLYLTQTIREFSKSGIADARALIRYLHDEKKVPNIIIVCASMGGQICNKLAHDHNDVARLSGIVLLGAIPDPKLATSHAVSVGLPIILAHGNDDVVYDWRGVQAVYQRIKSRTSRYPIKLILFNTGRHGTPIRMIDWRQTLNWVFKKS